MRGRNSEDVGNGERSTRRREAAGEVTENNWWLRKGYRAGNAKEQSRYDSGTEVEALFFVMAFPTCSKRFQGCDLAWFWRRAIARFEEKRRRVAIQPSQLSLLPANNIYCLLFFFTNSQELSFKTASVSPPSFLWYSYSPLHLFSE